MEHIPAEPVLGFTIIGIVILIIIYSIINDLTNKTDKTTDNKLDQLNTIVNKLEEVNKPETMLKRIKPM